MGSEMCIRDRSKHLDPHTLTVYVPTAPNPTSGYTLLVPPDEVHDVDMSVDDALKFVISMGVVLPQASPLSRAAGLAHAGAKA